VFAAGVAVSPAKSHPSDKQGGNEVRVLIVYHWDGI
jgi:hypothetical protein